MTTAPSTQASNQVLTIPNQITGVRLLLSVAVFVLIGLQYYTAAVILFLVAASTDWVDGYWARRYGAVSKLGRVFDPFVDKIIICGSFIYLCAQPQSRVVPWMAVVVVGRELLVTALRSSIEQSGGDFSANMSGKLKMVFQCAAVVASLLVLRKGDSPPDWLVWATAALVWLAVLSTLQSGFVYVIAAAKFWQNMPQEASGDE